MNIHHTEPHTRKEDHEFMLPLSSKGTILGINTRNPTNKELQMCPHVTCLSANECDTHNVCIPKSARTVEEEISRNIGTVMREGGSPGLTKTDSDRNSVSQIYDIGAMIRRMMGSVKVVLKPSRNVSETKTVVKYVPQAKEFQLKRLYSTVSPG